jgi:hypothetical protein
MNYQEMISIAKIKKEFTDIANKALNTELQNILMLIAEDYDIPFEELKTKYLDSVVTPVVAVKTNKIKYYPEKCNAKTTSNKQCARLKKPGELYCSGHLKKRNGDIDIVSEDII